MRSATFCSLEIVLNKVWSRILCLGVVLGSPAYLGRACWHQPGGRIWDTPWTKEEEEDKEEEERAMEIWRLPITCLTTHSLGHAVVSQEVKSRIDLCTYYWSEEESWSWAVAAPRGRWGCQEGETPFGLHFQSYNCTSEKSSCLSI